MVSQEASSQSLEEMKEHLRQLETPACELFTVLIQVHNNCSGGQIDDESAKNLQENLDKIEICQTSYRERNEKFEEYFRSKNGQEAAVYFKQATEIVAYLYDTAKMWTENNNNHLQQSDEERTRDVNLVASENAKLLAAMLKVSQLDFMRDPIEEEQKRTV